MKSNALEFLRWPPALLALLFAATLLVSCGGVDSKLVNKIKTFSPQWSSLNDEIAYVERNLKVLKEHFEKDFSQFEGMLDRVPDSLRGREYRQMLADYDQIIVDRDSIIQVFDSTNHLFNSTMTDYNQWEQKAMDGDIQFKEGNPRLKQFKQSRRVMSEGIAGMKVSLDEMVGVHNRVLRKLAEYLDIYTNYDLKIR